MKRKIIVAATLAIGALLGCARADASPCRWQNAQYATDPNWRGYDLTTTAALATSFVIAEGYYGESPAGRHRTLVEQWDGGSWTIVPSPNLGSLDNQITAVAIDSRSGAIFSAVSYQVRVGSGGVWRAALVIDDRISYVTHHLPHIGTLHNYPTAITWDQANNSASVGVNYVEGNNLRRAVLTYWVLQDKWTRIDIPDSKLAENDLKSMALVPGTHYLLVGGRRDDKAGSVKGDIFLVDPQTGAVSRDRVSEGHRFGDIVEGIAATPDRGIAAVGGFIGPSSYAPWIFSDSDPSTGDSYWSRGELPHQHEGTGLSVAAQSDSNVMIGGWKKVGSSIQPSAWQFDVTGWVSNSPPSPSTDDTQIDAVASLPGTSIYVATMSTKTSGIASATSSFCF